MVLHILDVLLQKGQQPEAADDKAFTEAFNSFSLVVVPAISNKVINTIDAICAVDIVTSTSQVAIRYVPIFGVDDEESRDHGPHRHHMIIPLLSRVGSSSPLTAPATLR